MAKFLLDYDLTTMEWTLLGYVSEHTKGGIKISDIAAVFDVEISLITNSLNRLASKQLIDRRVHPQDQRVRLIYITKQGKIIISKIEEVLAVDLAIWLKGVDETALASYVEVLEYLADNNRQSIRK